MEPVFAAMLVTMLQTGAGEAFEAPLAKLPQFRVPKSLPTWRKQRKAIRRTLWELLGDLPPRPKVPAVEALSRDPRQGYVLEKFQFDNGAGATVPGYLLIPEGLQGKAPAILYNHYHGGKYQQGKEELFLHWPTEEPPGEALVRRGYVVMCIDAYCFGERQWQGPAGKAEAGGQTESALFKYNVWVGRTLWGMMVCDDMMALDYLCSRPEVDAKRIGAMGMSMGSTRTWWLAALDDRISCAVCVACLTRYTNLIETGRLNDHGIYYYVPNMLQHFDTEAVVSLIAPRPLLTLTGDQDTGSPVEGVHLINRTVQQVYVLYDKPERFQGLIYPGVGHDYTPQMWEETLGWLDRWLRRTPTQARATRRTRVRVAAGRLVPT